MLCLQVALTTFDTPSELHKLARWHPGARALLRIRADDPAARCQLGNKYGAEPEDAPALLKVRLRNIPLLALLQKLNLSAKQQYWYRAGGCPYAPADVTKLLPRLRNLCCRKCLLQPIFHT